MHLCEYSIGVTLTKISIVSFQEILIRLGFHMTEQKHSETFVKHPLAVEFDYRDRDGDDERGLSSDIVPSELRLRISPPVCASPKTADFIPLDVVRNWMIEVVDAEYRSVIFELQDDIREDYVE